jgi:hypothetical protein
VVDATHTGTDELAHQTAHLLSVNHVLTMNMHTITIGLADEHDVLFTEILTTAEQSVSNVGWSARVHAIRTMHLICPTIRVFHGARVHKQTTLVALQVRVYSSVGQLHKLSFGRVVLWPSSFQSVCRCWPSAM